ncbi:MAG: hypothetical protein ACI8W3_002341 [Myxococcota bacterium]
MESQSSDVSNQIASKEAAALAALDANQLSNPKARRIRRRRRTVRRQLLDSMLPFAVLVGMTVLAVGMVEIVEVGAAKNSKVLSNYTHETNANQIPQKEFNYVAAQAQYQSMRSRHKEMKGQTSSRQNQMAYQLSLQAEMQRDLLGIPNVKPSTVPTVDVMDWSLFEEGDQDPRSTLQQGAAVRPAQ